MWAVRTIVQAIALATTGALLGLGVNALRPAGVSLLRPWVGDNDATAECALASADPVRIDAVAAVTPPSSVMNRRRFIRSTCIRHPNQRVRDSTAKDHVGSGWGDEPLRVKR